MNFQQSCEYKDTNAPLKSHSLKKSHLKKTKLFCCLQVGWTWETASLLEWCAAACIWTTAESWTSSRCIESRAHCFLEPQTLQTSHLKEKCWNAGAWS